MSSMLALLLVAAVAGFPAAGTYRYAASMAGQPIGTWSVNVVADAQQQRTEIDENSSAMVMGMQLAATGSLVLGSDLAPASYNGTYRTPTQTLVAHADLAADSATVTGIMTKAPQHLTLAANTHHFIVVEPGLLAGLFALPAQLNAWKEPMVTWIGPASAQAQPITINGAAQPARPAQVPQQDAVIAIDRPIGVVIWYDPATLVADQINVPSENAVLTRVR
jgi:hypothetical protein